jgi:hypothetical protein
MSGHDTAYRILICRLRVASAWPLFEGTPKMLHNSGRSSRRKRNRKSSRDIKPTRRFEALDKRCVLAAHLAGGVLEISGGSRNDLIEVGAGTFVHVTINGKESKFLASDVQSIEINAGGGDDRVTVSENVQIKCRIDAGDGNDNVTGGSASDSIVGGRGNDTLRGRNGNDHIFGNSGDDVIEGNNDDDSIHGGSGRDDCSGGNGNDDVSGDDGDDRLRGNDGDDSLHGNRGRDRIFGGLGDDFCDGGEDDDFMRGDGGHDVYDDHGHDNVDDDHEDEHEDNGFFVSGQNKELEMQVQSGSLFAKIKYEQEPEGGGVERKFRVEAFGATEGQVLNVVVDGINVGSITADSFGRGSLLLQDGTGSPLPMNFPTIQAGITISVGAASGTVPMAQPFPTDD